MLFIGGALVSSAPTKQVCTNKASMHQQSKYAPTKQVCTNKASMHQHSRTRRMG